MYLDVTTAYFDAALSDRLVAIMQATLDQAGATLSQIEAQFNVGNLPEFEVLRARVSRDSQRAALIGAEAQRELAYLRLKQLLEIPADEPLELDVDLSDPSGAAGRAVERRPGDAEAGYVPIDRIAVQQVEAVVAAGEAAVEIARAQRKPTVSLTSGFIAYAYDKVPAFDRRDWTLTGAITLSDSRRRAAEGHGAHGPDEPRGESGAAQARRRTGRTRQPVGLCRLPRRRARRSRPPAARCNRPSGRSRSPRCATARGCPRNWS